MRLIWQSKAESGSTACPVVALSQSANFTLAWRLALRKDSWKAESVDSDLSRRNSSRSAIQPSPMARVIAWASGGLASSNQRLGVTPLVLLLKRSGKRSARDLTVVVFSRPE